LKIKENHTDRRENYQQIHIRIQHLQGYAGHTE